MKIKRAKGELTRQTIVDAARVLFNENSLNITLEVLAQEMGVTKGRITNHFSTKDKLFVAILQDYEEKLQQLVQKHAAQYMSPKLQDHVDLLSRVMDLQYEYRSSIIYLNVTTPGQNEIRAHVSVQANMRIASIRRRTEMLVSGKVLTEDLLQEQNFNSFLFIFINQMTQWVVYHDMYSQGLSVQQLKPVYLRGIFLHAYFPYLTPKGKKEFQQLRFE